MLDSTRPRDTWITLPDSSKMPMSWRSDPHRWEAYQTRLKASHGLEDRPHCDCRQKGRKLEVTIHRRETEGGKVVRYHLARMKNEGRLHRESCAFYEMDPDASGAAGYVSGVIDEREDGTTHLRLSRSLRIAQRRSTVDEAPPAVAGGRAGKATRRAMTELGLLNLIWEKAGLTLWHPGFAGKREMWRVAHRLQEAAETIVCGRTDLHKQLAVIVPGSKREATHLTELAGTAAGERYLVVIGVVHQAMASQGRISLRGAMPPYNLFMNYAPARITDLLARHPYASRILAAEPSGRPAQVVGLFIVKATAGTWKGAPVIRGEVEAAALMETTHDFVPVASSLEQQVADRLVAEGRHFSKPLRYDAEADLVFPDFVLLDTGQARGTPMEVFGRADEVYEARRAEKERYYQEQYGSAGWWSWNAAGPSAAPMAAFPSISRGNTT